MDSLPCSSCPAPLARWFASLQLILDSPCCSMLFSVLFACPNSAHARQADDLSSAPPAGIASIAVPHCRGGRSRKKKWPPVGGHHSGVTFLLLLLLLALFLERLLGSLLGLFLAHVITPPGQVPEKFRLFREDFEAGSSSRCGNEKGISGARRGRVSCAPCRGSGRLPPPAWQTPGGRRWRRAPPKGWRRRGWSG